MKQLTTAMAVFGPFNNIEQRSDHYDCDGIVYPINVIGDAVIGDWVPTGSVPETAIQHNGPILAALAAIDAKTIRPLREGDIARLAALDAEAVALRSQLMKV